MIDTCRKKGKKLFTAESNYCVIDLETTGFYAQNKITELSALRIRNNEVTDTFTTLVNPQIHIPSQTTLITHISDRMVEGAPKIEDVFNDFLDFIGDDIVVGHNIDSYDYNIIYDLNMLLNKKPFENKYIDTFKLSQMYLPEAGNWRLTILATYLGIEITNAHRAEADCYTTHRLYQELKKLISDCSQTVCIKQDKKQNLYATFDHSINVNPFYGKTCIVYGTFDSIDTDKVKRFVEMLGAEYVDFFCYSAQYLILGTKMYKKYLCLESDELIDNVANRTNIRIIPEEIFISYSNAVMSLNSNGLNVKFAFELTGKTVCLTGEFKCGERDKIQNSLIAKNAIVKSNVIKGLDYLVIGSNGSAEWKNGKGSKLKKAEEYNNNGGKITIIKEQDFIISGE